MLPATCWLSADGFVNLSLATGSKLITWYFLFEISNQKQLSRLRLTSFWPFCLGSLFGIYRWRGKKRTLSQLRWVWESCKLNFSTMIAGSNETVLEFAVSSEPASWSQYLKAQTILVSTFTLGSAHIQTSILSPTSDETVSLILWNSTELTVTILCATIPTLRPLYKQCMRLFSRSNDRRQSYRLDGSTPKNEAFKFTPYTSNSKASVVVGHRDTDSRSAKVVLGHRGEDSERRIVCTEVVNVEFEERAEPYPPNNWPLRTCHNWEMVWFSSCMSPRVCFRFHNPAFIDLSFKCNI